MFSVCCSIFVWACYHKVVCKVRPSYNTTFGQLLNNCSHNSKLDGCTIMNWCVWSWPHITLLNTCCSFGGPLDYNGWVFEKLRRRLNFSSIRLLCFKGALNKQQVLSNVMHISSIRGCLYQGLQSCPCQMAFLHGLIYGKMHFLSLWGLHKV